MTLLAEFNQACDRASSWAADRKRRFLDALIGRGAERIARDVRNAIFAGFGAIAASRLLAPAFDWTLAAISFSNGTHLWLTASTNGVAGVVIGLLLLATACFTIFDRPKALSFTKHMAKREQRILIIGGALLIPFFGFAIGTSGTVAFAYILAALFAVFSAFLIVQFAIIAALTWILSSPIITVLFCPVAAILVAWSIRKTVIAAHAALEGDTLATRQSTPSEEALDWNIEEDAIDEDEGNGFIIPAGEDAEPVFDQKLS